MDLKKLYGDVCIKLKRELPIYEFLSYADFGVRALLCRYPKKLLICKGEYTSIENLNGSLVLNEAFYTALLYFIAGTASDDTEMLEKAHAEAECAYKTLWKKAAHGKRMVCDRW